TRQPNTKERVPGIIASRVSGLWKNIYKQETFPAVSQEVSYLMAISSLEPRKNYVALIKAWSLYRLQTGKDLKLVIVGGWGWKMAEILREAEQYIRQGNLYILADVSKADLEILLSNAEALA